MGSKTHLISIILQVADIIWCQLFQLHRLEELQRLVRLRTSSCGSTEDEFVRGRTPVGWEEGPSAAQTTGGAAGLSGDFFGAAPFDGRIYVGKPFQILQSKLFTNVTSS